MLAGTGLQVVPGLAAQLGQRRLLRVGADVAADLADLFMRDVDAVVAAEREQQVVARDPCDLLRLEAAQLGDAVVLVDDVVSGAQIGEALQRTAGRSGGARGTLAEDLRVGEQREPEVAPDEPAARGRDREDDAARLLAGLEHVSLRAADKGLLPQGLAAMREGDDDVELLAQEPVELVLGL